MPETSAKTPAANPPEPAVACSLPIAELSDRRAVWRRLEQDALIDRRATAHGVRLQYAAKGEVEGQLRELARLEAECCSFAEWSVERDRDRVVLSVGAQGEGIAAIQALFETAPPATAD